MVIPLKIVAFQNNFSCICYIFSLTYLQFFNFNKISPLGFGQHKNDNIHWNSLLNHILLSKRIRYGLISIYKEGLSVRKRK